MQHSNETDHRDHLRKRRIQIPRIMTVGDFELSLLPPTSYDVKYIPSDPIIGFAFDSQEGMHGFASDKVKPFRARANGVAFLPADCEVISRSKKGGEYLNIIIRGTPSKELQLQNQFTDLVDSIVIPTAECLRRMMISNLMFDPLEYDEQITKLCAYISSSSEMQREQSSARWMTKRRLKNVDEFIEVEMASQLKVKDVAGMLGLSEGFFNRSFKAAMGKTPHRYILDRRRAKARELIIATNNKLADIAIDCGFSSQAHMTTQIKRSVGLTPAELRNERVR
ncbi:MAG: hypothetical protein DHS20C07_29480 [Methyloligella sp.]|nr:MAG: hypothetical protein DHS20C07_29480 [Methyloligella sp.]